MDLDVRVKATLLGAVFLLVSALSNRGIGLLDRASSRRIATHLAMK